jgi:hypothetical protein
MKRHTIHLPANPTGWRTGRVPVGYVTIRPRPGKPGRMVQVVRVSDTKGVRL